MRRNGSTSPPLAQLPQRGATVTRRRRVFRHADALRVALTALAPTLPQYRRSVLAYAEALGRTRPPSESAPLPENWGIEGDPAQL